MKLILGIFVLSLFVSCCFADVKLYKFGVCDKKENYTIKTSNDLALNLIKRIIQIDGTIEIQDRIIDPFDVSRGNVGALYFKIKKLSVISLKITDKSTNFKV
jgi:hypothetical protein